MAQKFVVQQSFVGLLYEDGAFKRALSPGRYEFKRPWFGKTIERRVAMVEMRERSLTIKGQEILTKDKVAIRVSLLVYFRVEDAEAALHNVANYEERIYEDVQLAARRFLASRDLDAILSDRNEISDAVRDDVKAIAAGYGVAIVRADVKDLAFPGNLREIMNQVLETERRAEAHLIEARREAEALKIKADAENAAANARVQSEKERAQLTAEVEQERLRGRLAAEVEEARALRDHPELLRLREIQALAEMAKSGARFVIGLPVDAPGLALLEQGDAGKPRR
jgi:regulator of protease activity HflC (stomatin/prohibitin superfamily)